jgi:hypothetical protein
MQTTRQGPFGRWVIQNGGAEIFFYELLFFTIVKMKATE